MAAESSQKPTHPPPQAPKSNDPNVSHIVDAISGLTLLQAADLVTLLKVGEIVVNRNGADGVVEISYG